MKRPSIGVCAILLASATMFGGAVAAQTSGGDNRDVPADRAGPDENDVMYASAAELAATRAFDPNVQIYNVPAAAFTADGFNPDSQFFVFSGGQIQGNAKSYGCTVAPVQLPDGSRVNELVGFLLDNDGTQNATLTLRRVANGVGGAETMALVATSGNSTAIQIPGDNTVEQNVIDNASYSYYLTICVLSSNLRIFAAQLSYQEDLVVDPHSPVIVPVTPFRVYDSRFGDGPLARGANRLVSVRRSINVGTGDVIDNDAVPNGATAIMFNVAITNTVGGGFLAVTPGNATASSSASINWTAAGQTLNNGTFVQLDGNRRIKAFVNGVPGSSTDFIIDVTGYVLPG